MPFELPVQVSGFGPAISPDMNGFFLECFSTSDIIRAAVLAGYGAGGVDWRIRAWRIASIRMAVNFPVGPSPMLLGKLSHPRAWLQLDPSEKASISNLLGNIATKLLCERILDAPRLWFLDVYRNRFSVKLAGKRRPDFFTQTRAGQWLSVEAKGRSYGPSIPKLNSAKTQANAVVRINGSKVVAHVVCWTMSRGGAVSARFHDPEPADEGDSLTVEPGELFRDYYEPVRQMMQGSPLVEYPHGLKLFRFEAADFLIGIHPRIERYLETDIDYVAPTDAGFSKKLPHFRAEPPLEPVGEIVAGPDGVIIIPGRSWPVA